MVGRCYGDWLMFTSSFQLFLPAVHTSLVFAITEGEKLRKSRVVAGEAAVRTVRIWAVESWNRWSIS